MQQYLLLGCCPYLNGNRKVNSSRRPRNLYSYLIWVLWLSCMCPVHRRRVRFSSHPSCWALKKHMKGKDLYIRNWWGLNSHLNLIWTEQAKTCALQRNITIWAVTQQQTWIASICPQADTSAESLGLRFHALKYNFPQKQI